MNQIPYKWKNTNADQPKEWCDKWMSFLLSNEMIKILMNEQNKSNRMRSTESKVILKLQTWQKEIKSRKMKLTNLGHPLSND